MKPLSPRKRRVYVWIFAALFFFSVPIALLYAAGYRYKAGFGLVETGGISVSVPYSDATVFLNGSEIGRSNILTRSFYINDLAPSAYVLHASRASSTPWYRTVVVEPKIVTEAHAVLTPDEVELTRLLRGGSSTTTTRSISPKTYDKYLSAFKMSATSTESVSEKADMIAVVRKGDVFAMWTAMDKKTPDNFCLRPSSCVAEFAIEHGRQTAYSVALWNGGVVYSTREGGIFFSESDVRPTPVTVPLYAKAKADMRVVDDALIIKDGNLLFQVESF